MSDPITADRATELVAMSVADLSVELPALDRASLDLILKAEEARGEQVRSTAIAAITAAIDALPKPEADEVGEANVDVPEAPEAEAPAPLPASGEIRMRNADGGGCSYRGTSYEPDADGFVTVPLTAYADLIDHGFSYKG